MPLMQTILLTMYPKEKRGSIMGLAGLVTGFAPAVGPTLSGWILEHLTWRHLFLLSSCFSRGIDSSDDFMKNVTSKKKSS